MNTGPAAPVIQSAACSTRLKQRITSPLQALNTVIWPPRVGSSSSSRVEVQVLRGRTMNLELRAGQCRVSLNRLLPYNLSIHYPCPVRPSSPGSQCQRSIQMAKNGVATEVIPSSPDAGPSQSPRLASPGQSPRSSVDEGTPAERIAQLEDDLATTRGEKEVLSNQYRTLLGKLTAMRASLGEKLREDAVCLSLCCRETVADPSGRAGSTRNDDQQPPV